MDASFLTSVWFSVVTHALASATAFFAALTLSSAVRINKGATVNLALIFVALGLILIGLSEGGKLVEIFELSFLEGWHGALMAAGTIFIFTGAIIWRSLVKKATN